MVIPYQRLGEWSLIYFDCLYQYSLNVSSSGSKFQMSTSLCVIYLPLKSLLKLIPLTLTPLVFDTPTTWTGFWLFTQHNFTYFYQITPLSLFHSSLSNLTPCANSSTPANHLEDQQCTFSSATSFFIYCDQNCRQDSMCSINIGM